MGQLYIVTNDELTNGSSVARQNKSTRLRLDDVSVAINIRCHWWSISCISLELSNHWIYNVCYKNTLLKSLYDMCIKYVNGYRQVSNIKGTLVWQLNCWITQILLEHRLSALLQLYLHSRLNTWLRWIGQRRLQDDMRIIQVLGIVASYIRCVPICIFI